MDTGSAFDVKLPSSCKQQCGSLTQSANIEEKAPVVEWDGMTSLVASEMNKLTFKEREIVYEDLHAVSKPDEETSVNINKAISEMKEALATIRLKPAYNKALFLNREYVDDTSFLLMFLRSTQFDTKEAAHRIVDHFKYKLELFGQDMLGRDLMYEDIDEDTKQALSSGAVQVPTSRDTAGRAIIFYAFDHLQYRSVDSQLRAVWYLMMCALKDPCTSKNGAIHVSYNIGYSSKNLHLDLLLKSSMIAKSMPQRIMGVHFCYDREIMHPLASMLQSVLGSAARMRFRAHYGSFLEVMYSLRNFGIPTAELPIDVDGNLTCNKIYESIAERIKEDEQKKEELAGKIMHPLSVDVVLGRGWHQQKHPGNLWLARIVDEHRESYKAARKLHKTNINWRIVEIIREVGGRFLERSQQPGGGWVEACHESARDKVSKCFRTNTKQNAITTGTEEISGDRIIGKHAATALYIPPSDDENFASKKARI